MSHSDFAHVSKKIIRQHLRAKSPNPPPNFTVHIELRKGCKFKMAVAQVIWLLRQQKVAVSEWMSFLAEGPGTRTAVICRFSKLFGLETADKPSGLHLHFSRSTSPWHGRERCELYIYIVKKPYTTLLQTDYCSLWLDYCPVDILQISQTPCHCVTWEASLRFTHLRPPWTRHPVFPFSHMNVGIDRKIHGNISSF